MIGTKTIIKNPRSICLLFSLALLATLLTAGPGYSKDIYKNAVKFYEQGSHEKAKSYFHHIIKHKPDHWQSHYYLATIHMRNNDLVLARKYYNSCVVNFPDIPTCKKIVQALKIIDQKEKVKKIPSTPIASNDNNASKKAKLTPLQKKKLALLEKIKAEELANHEKQKSACENRKKQIIAEAEKRANEAIASGEREIQALHMNTNWYVKNSVTGVVSVGVPTVVENEIRGRAQIRANRIREIAHQRARGIKLPQAPRLTNSVSHQLTATPTKSGTRLHHVGTNLYVRNYKHDSSKKAQKKIAESTNQKTF